MTVTEALTKVLKDGTFVLDWLAGYICNAADATRHCLFSQEMIDEQLLGKTYKSVAFKIDMLDVERTKEVYEAINDYHESYRKFLDMAESQSITGVQADKAREAEYGIYTMLKERLDGKRATIDMALLEKFENHFLPAIKKAIFDKTMRKNKHAGRPTNTDQKAQIAHGIGLMKNGKSASEAAEITIEIGELTKRWPNGYNNRQKDALRRSLGREKKRLKEIGQWTI